MRCTLAAASVVLFASVAIWGLGCGSSSSSDCGTFCAALETCGMLPSPFGVDRSSCNDACEASSDGTQTTFTACGLPKTPNACSSLDRGASSPWCCSASCGKFAACLETAGGTAVVPKATVTVQFVELDDKTQPIRRDDIQGFGACGAPPTGTMLDPVPYCSGLEGTTKHAPIQAVSVFLDTDVGTVAPQADTCEDLLTSVVFSAVEPTALRAGVTLQVSSTESEPGDCLVFWSDRVAARPGESIEVDIPIPSRERLECGGGNGAGVCPPGRGSCIRYRCENDATSCHDGCDNDGDGRVDCQSLGCRSLPECANGG
jgi:hypothetical protein